MGVLFGLLAALLWGSGDVLINRLTGLIGTTRALVVTQVASLFCWVGLAFVLGLPHSPTPAIWGLALLCGVFHVAGLAFTYRAFEVGTLSIVSPIASSFAIVTAVLALISGERPSGPALSGAGLLVLGVIIVTRASPSGGTATLKGIPEAIGSAVGFGIMFWLIEGVTKSVGMAMPLLVLKAMATTSAVGAALWSRNMEKTTESSLVRPEVLLLGAGVAVSDTLAWWAFIAGTQTKFTSVVTALASLFSVVTVILAAVFLKERLNRPQMIGVGVVLLGILLVSL